MRIDLSRFQRGFLGGAGLGLAILGYRAHAGDAHLAAMILYFMAGGAFLLASVRDRSGEE